MKIVIFGDLCMQYLNIKECEKIAQNLKKIKSKDDIFIANLECPITDHKNKIIKNGPNLSVNIDKAKKILDLLPIDIFTLANNHIFDYGKKGLEDTIQTLEEKRKLYLGAGLNITAANSPLILEKGDEKIAFLNVTESEFCLASHYSAGASSCEPIFLLKRIQSAKKLAGKVIVIIHGGNENYYLPSPYYQAFMRFIIDAGADCVVTHHTHNASGMEKYNDKYIFYSLGNFIFPIEEEVEPYWHYGHGIKLDTKKMEFFNIIPYKQGLNGIPFSFLEGSEHTKYLMEFENKSKVIESYELLCEEWNKFKKSRENAYVNWLTMSSKVSRAINKIFNLNLYDIKSSNKKITLQNILQCESHKNLLLEIIQEKNKK
ncbi:CapA family protein [Xenorhabdus thuongxuanensis]|uniref:CapA, required for Poly-gamma-glutamate transport n=1 Tax=Xenorhabdus thuongxuanensis TaxID=1873484 RepID=A0A1Q5U6S8_9GAMM|nr:CapA family protein [Xenorhabdus thuongxuanensis]OKP08193.1 CapA, required for Poly-gamma-glutamate transport [Xenorhabdus thuongxuanensis]